MASQEKEYLLGTHDAEVERLGLQHRAWRPRALAAWESAGIAPGYLSDRRSEAIWQAFADLESREGTWMITPGVLEIIAVRRSP